MAEKLQGLLRTKSLGHIGKGQSHSKVVDSDKSFGIGYYVVPKEENSDF
jgi:hypothetical protein